MARPATLEDAAPIASIIVAAFEEYRGWLVPPSAPLLETPHTVSAQLARSHGGALVEMDGRAVGCVLFEPRGSNLYFGRLSVLPAHRGAGLAAALVHYVQAEAARRRLGGVTLSVRIALPENRRFFEHLGYVEVGRQAHPGFDEPTWIDMRKAFQPTAF